MMPEASAKLDLNHLLTMEGLEGSTLRVAVARHVPSAHDLQRALPWLATEKHDIYNAYQQAQKPEVTVLRHADYLVSCVSHPKGALFIGVYRVSGCRTMSLDEYWRIPANRELRTLGMTWNDKDNGVSWFNLELQNVLQEWKGKLIFEWPPGRRWDRWLDRARFAEGYSRR